MATSWNVDSWGVYRGHLVLDICVISLMTWLVSHIREHRWLYISKSSVSYDYWLCHFVSIGKSIDSILRTRHEDPSDVTLLVCLLLFRPCLLIGVGFGYGWLFLRLVGKCGSWWCCWAGLRFVWWLPRLSGVVDALVFPVGVRSSVGKWLKQILNWIVWNEKSKVLGQWEECEIGLVEHVAWYVRSIPS